MATASPVDCGTCWPEENGEGEGSQPHSTVINNNLDLEGYDVGRDDKESEGIQDPSAAVHHALSEIECSELLKRALSVDSEVMRGISLKVGLRRFGRLWRFCPADLPIEDRSALWSLSKPVKAFDIFLSHSWRTKGWRKLVALSLRFGWPLFLGFWFVGILIVEFLCLAGLLPMGGHYEVRWGGKVENVPFGAWGCLASLLSLLAFLVWPYLPDARGRTLTCFLDVASINQVDAETMKRGIYGLGGFLASSETLLILWSKPYLSRLWCVFEVAAYRHANPNGKIILAPLFVENGVANISVCVHVFMTVYLLFMQAFPINEALALGLSIGPSYWYVHSLCSAMRTKHDLFKQMSAFKMESVQCREDFDRQYIHRAIVSWYGSHGAFEEFVRGPLRQELSSQADTQMPIAYAITIAAPFIAMGLDILVGILLSPLPLDAAISFFFGSVLGTMLCWNLVTLYFSLRLCSLVAGPSNSRLKEHGRSLMVFSAFLVVAFGGLFVGRLSYNHSLARSLVWFLAASLSVGLACGGWRRVAQLCRRKAPVPTNQPSESYSGTENKEMSQTAQVAEISKGPETEEKLWEV